MHACAYRAIYCYAKYLWQHLATIAVVHEIAAEGFKLMMSFVQLLLFSYIALSCYMCNSYGQTVINVAHGVYSTKAECDGLYLPVATTFKRIEALTTKIHVTSWSSIFVHYQITLTSNGYDFWSKLQIYDSDKGSLSNAGSLVHSGNQYYKTAVGYYMAHLGPGYYTFEVHYRSSVSISISSSTDWQTAILQAMWFEGGYAVSDGINCYPEPSVLNTYNILSPVKNLEAKLHSYYGVVIAAYQLSIYSSSNQWFVTRLNMNNQQLPGTSMIAGCGPYLDLHGLWMGYLYWGEYYFGVSYRNNYNSYFEDCRNNYHGNKNLFAMRLSYRCARLVNARPTSSLYATSSWRNTDLTYTTIFHNSVNHVIVRYQYSTTGRGTYTITRLLVDSIIQKHTASIKGNGEYAGNSGVWQGTLIAGRHTFTVQHRTGNSYYHTVSGDSYIRAMDIVYCY